MDTVRWKLKEYLAQHNLSAYALTKTARLSPNTVYTIARGDTNQVRLETLAGLLGGLRQLTGKEVQFSDVLEHEVVPEPAPTAAGGIEAEHHTWEGALLEPAESPIHEPYDWGSEGPPKSKPLHFVEGRGWIVEGGKHGG